MKTTSGLAILWRTQQCGAQTPQPGLLVLIRSPTLCRHLCNPTARGFARLQVPHLCNGALSASSHSEANASCEGLEGRARLLLRP